MSTIKDFNVKIKSLKNTRKITKTMKMVSASKLRKAHEAQASAKQYAQNLTALIGRIASIVESTEHPLLAARPMPRSALILVITADKGLCGAFNHNANRHVAMWIRENSAQYAKIGLSFCGKKGFQFFRRNSGVCSHYENVINKPQFADAKRIGDDLGRAFLDGHYDEVYLAYNQFFSPLSQKTVFEKILPIDPDILLKGDVQHNGWYLFEPASSELLAFLIPHFLYFRVYFALLENSAGEHGARMSAMDNATKNASDLIERYTLRRNRARQAQITTELTEIVAGAEALK